MRKHFAITAATFLLVLASGPAFAAQGDQPDSRWAPWLGCWQLWEEQFESPEALDAANDSSDIDALVDRTSVCVTPVQGGITLTATAGDRLLVERRVVADGEPHDVTEDGCRGWERSQWSTDGHRLFTSGVLECDGAARRVTGMSLLASPSSWVDIQLVETDDHQQLEIRRYAPMPSGPESSASFTAAEIRQARREAAEPPVLFDVTEANDTTHARVVEAFLVELEPELDIDSDALIALDDAGISHDVIDLLVALSYPEEFVVERRNRGGAWSSTGGYGGFGGFYDPVWYSDLYPYYVSPFGARHWGGGYSPYVYGGAFASPFIVLRDTVIDQPTARAVQGTGYTRVVPREPEGGTVVSRGRTSSGRSGSGGSAVRTGSSGGSGASQGGFSGGGRSTGRTAVPRE